MVARFQAATHEPPEAKRLLDVPEHRLYGDGTLPVKLSAGTAPQPLLHDGDGSRRRRGGNLPARRPFAALPFTAYRHQEFRAFLKQVARAYPDVELHLVMDNHAAHKHPAVKAWLAANPRITCHFTPTHASWMNLVEVWFGIVERQAIRRGVFKSVRDLNTKIRAFIDGWNDRKHPFIWTKTADDILKKANRQNTSNTDH